jgi:hypothetical protein
MSDEDRNSLSIRVPAELKNRMRRIARIRGISISDLGRAMIESSPLLTGDEVISNADPGLVVLKLADIFATAEFNEHGRKQIAEQLRALGRNIQAGKLG